MRSSAPSRRASCASSSTCCRQGGASPVDDLLAQAQAALDAGDARAAADGFARVLKEDPRQPKAIAGMIRARVAQGDVGGARKLVSGLPQDIAGSAEIPAALTAVDVAEEAKRAAGDLAGLERKVAADPADLQARFDLALALFGRGRSEAAIDELLEVIRRDGGWNDEAARKQLVKIFDALGPSHPLTAASRRRLSSLLFS